MQDYRYLSKIFRGRDGACLASFTSGRYNSAGDDAGRPARSHISVFRRQFYVQLVRGTFVGSMTQISQGRVKDSLEGFLLPKRGRTASAEILARPCGILIIFTIILRGAVNII